jgi:phenazine biosynthesis protein phzE
VQVGATLVRNSSPDYEVQETHAKIAGLLTAAGITHRSANIMRCSELLASDLVRYQLAARNEWLSRFWFVDQEARKKLPLATPLTRKHVVIFDFEDNFTRMLAHMLTSLGAVVRILPWEQWAPDKLSADLVIIGPGPGDPANSSDPRIATGQRAARYMLDSGRPFMAVCLGHQMLAQALGLELFRKERATQGTQAIVELFGKPERVGFYNTFAARYSRPLQSIEISALSDGEVYATRGPHFVSFQFHVESILTENGPEILAKALTGILA